jgi:hypothetical protein
MIQEPQTVELEAFCLVISEKKLFELKLPPDVINNKFFVDSLLNNVLDASVYPIVADRGSS